MCLGIPGRVTKVYEQDGQPMAKVDPRLYNAAVAHEKAAYARCVADVKRIEALLAQAIRNENRGKKLQVTINNLVVNGERFRIGFGNEVPGHADAMPVKRTTDEEGKLFLTPGGIYTSTDIRANGNTVPAVKYNGVRPAHDSHPKPGQKICPISETVSNPKFTWVVGGQSYEFCCVPCIEEFVAAAHGGDMDPF